MKYSKELKIGVFVVAVLVMSFFVINYLRGEDIFNKEIELVSSYDNVEGLVASAPVYIKGYKAGKVKEVAYQPESDDFKVICSVLKEFRIPEDSRMTIYAVDIMGGKGVRLDLGESESLVADGAYLAPAYEAGLLDGIAAGIGPLLEKVGNTLDSLSVTVSGINSMLADANVASISRTLRHLERTMNNVEAVSATVGGKSDELNSFIDNLASLTDKFGGIADKVDSTMTDVTSITSVISESDIQGVVASFGSLLEKIDDPEGTVGKLLVDGSLYDSLDELLIDIDSLIEKIQENPKKYLRISVF